MRRGGGGSPLSIIFLPLANVASSDSGGNNKAQCRETAPRLFPSVDKALAAAEWGERESFLHPWDRQRVRRSCALAAVTCPGATRKFPPQFPVCFSLIVCLAPISTARTMHCAEDLRLTSRHRGNACNVI